MSTGDPRIHRWRIRETKELAKNEGSVSRSISAANLRFRVWTTNSFDFHIFHNLNRLCKALGD